MTDFRIADWLAQPSLNRLSLGDTLVRLEPKVMQVLEALAERPGEVIPRDELVARVWPGVFVTDDVLHRAVRELRRAFGDDSGSPRYIETIRKRGYRLIAPVTPAAAVPPAAGAGMAPASEVVPAPASSVPSVQSVAPPASVPSVPSVQSVALVAALALAIGAVVSTLAVRSSDAVAPVAAAVRFVPLTSGPMNEADPSLAPDGRLAFVRLPLPWSGGQADIFVLDPRGGEARRVTDSPADDRLPVWSPDASALAFVRATPSTCTIVLHDVASGEERDVTPCLNREEPRPAWTRDGRWLVMSVAEPQARGGWQLARVSLATGAREPLTLPPPGALGDHSPVVSPDGRLVAFVRTVGGGASDVWVVPVTGGTARRITRDDSDLQGVDWADEGRSLVYSSDRAGGYGLWRVPLEGGTPELLVGGSARLKHPASDAGGSRIAYESWAYEINIYEAGAESLGEEPVAPSPIIRTSELWNLHPQPSPDGTRLAYVSTGAGNQEVWLSAADGASPRRLTRFARGSLRAPRWSPDGSRLVVPALVGGVMDLYLVDAVSGETRPLTETPADEVAPSWSPDGTEVFYGTRVDGLWQVQAIDVASRARRTVTTDGGYAAQPSPDGRWLYFTRADRAGLYRMPSAGGASERVVDNVWTANWADWQVTSDGIYFAHGGADDQIHVSRASFDGAGITEVAVLPNYSWPGIAITRDGKVLYAKWDRRESNILSVELKIAD
ncbi:MAG: winged helix-turn-helix domain-containing protein [Vicinamibacterales bacterium]